MPGAFGPEGEGVGDPEGVAVGFDEVAAFEVFLELELCNDGLSVGGLGVRAVGVEGGCERWD